MAMAAMSRPRTRIHLFHVKRKGEWQVWELIESVPPSTQQELALDRSPDDRSGTGSRSPVESQELLPALVMEVSADGEVVTWPGPVVA